MNDRQISNRQSICDTLLELAERDADIVVLTSDSRGSASLAAFARRFPQRHVEVGIAEQNLVGIAAGLASMGKKPVAVSPASFLSMRAIEQIKVDVAYSQLPVVLYGISGGLSYGALGMSHHSLQDIAAFCAIPGIEVMLPADRFASRDMIRDVLAHPRPVYLRVGRNPVEDVYEDGVSHYISGKATVVREGTDACVIATGEMVYAAKRAGEILAEEGIQARVLDMHTLKPLDEEAIRAACAAGFIVTMEEHSIYGGLGSMVCRVVSESIPVPVRVLAVPDEPVIAGKSAEVFARYGLTADRTAQVIRERKKYII
jgi:transketolase